MSEIKVDLEKLATLEKELEILGSKVSAKAGELEILTRECDTLRSNAEKEATQIKQQAQGEAQEIINKANALFTEAQEKLTTVQKREEESKAIELLQKNLSDSQKAVEEQRISNNAMRISLGDKERKAELLIEQYEKKLLELGETPVTQKPIQKTEEKGMKKKSKK